MQRGQGFTPPEWWLDELEAALEARRDRDEPITHERLARLVAVELGRDYPYDTSTVSRFLGGKNRTFEMTGGLSMVLAIPIPMYVARDAREALELQATMMRNTERLNSGR